MRYIVATWYIVQVYSDGNTEWRFLTSSPQIQQVLKECLWEAFHPSKRAGQISIISFTFRTQRAAPTCTKLEWLFYRISLFTLHAQCDAPTYTTTSVGLAQAHPN